MVNPYYKVEVNAGEGGSVNASANGVLFGESATLTITPDEGYFVESFKLNGVNVAVTDNAYTIGGINKHYTVEVKFAKIEIESVSIKLTDSISMLYTAILDTADGAEMRFIMNGKETTVTPTEAGKHRYVFEFRNVSPQCMTDAVYAELIVNGEVVDTLDGYSIRAYSDSTLTKIENKAIAGYTDEQYAALKQLVIDMLEYGAMAQHYTNYKTDDLANAGITSASEFSPLSDEYDMVYNASESENAYFTACGVRFDYINSIYFKFKLDGIDAEAVKVVFESLKNGDRNEYSALDFIDLGDGYFKVYSDGIKPTSFDERFNVMLVVDGSVAQTIEYSVSAYVYYIQYKTDDSELSDMAYLARALYTYGKSAVEYAEIM